MKKIILLGLFTFLTTSVSLAQDFGLFTRGNLSVGPNYSQIYDAGIDLENRTGGAMGLEGGAQIGFANNLNVNLSTGFQINIALMTSSFNDIRSSTAVFYNRNFISFGLVKGIDLSHRTITDILLGAGIQYNVAGKLSITENDFYQGKVIFNPALGFYLESGISLKLSHNLSLDPTIRYRLLSFEVDDNQLGSSDQIRPDIENFNANGVEFALTLVRSFN